MATLNRSSSSTSSLAFDTPHYEETAVIGAGAYGTVYKGIDIKTGKVVAMKRIRTQITIEGLLVATVREIAYLRQLEKFDNENIVKLLDVCYGPRLQSEQSIVLIFDYVDYDLDRFMKKFIVGEETIRHLMRQMTKGIDFLHTNRIVHRDIKPQNVLVTENQIVKIADFGLARIYGAAKALTVLVVTLWYRSPEVLLHSTYSAPVDLWSLGCIFAEMYLLRPLFEGISPFEQLYKIFEHLGLPSEADWPAKSNIMLCSFDKAKKAMTRSEQATYLQKLIPTMSTSAIDLLQCLLDYNVAHRCTALEALKHVYFTDTEYKVTQLSLRNEPDPLNAATNGSNKENVCRPAILKGNKRKRNK